MPEPAMPARPRAFRLARASIAALALALPLGATAAAQTARVGSDTGFEVPRFVSLKSGRVNLRVGPGRDYRVAWVFTRAGMPVEIVQEFDRWRRIRVADGTEGWVYGALLAGSRTGVVAPWLDRQVAEPVELHRKARSDSRIVARIEPGVTGTLVECDGEWCLFEPHSKRGEVVGWLPQVELWGAYPGESFGE